MKIGLLFAGQSQQYPSMGIDLVEKYEIAKEIYHNANEILAYDLLEVSSDERIHQTIYTQPAILTLSYVILEILKAHNFKYECVAGLSLGEYSALVAAKVIDFETALKIIKKRAYIMDNALEKGSSKMAAVLSDDLDTINDVLNNPSLENLVAICNYNTDDQIVIGGEINKLNDAINLLKEAGIRKVIPLEVSSVSHMHLLEGAGLKLKEELEKFNFNKPECLFINNIDGNYQESDFVDSLTKQIYCSTKMNKTINLMLDAKIDTFIEIGPKNALSKIVKSIAKKRKIEVKILNAYDVSSLETTLKEMELD